VVDIAGEKGHIIHIIHNSCFLKIMLR